MKVKHFGKEEIPEYGFAFDLSGKSKEYKLFKASERRDCIFEVRVEEEEEEYKILSEIRQIEQIKKLFQKYLIIKIDEEEYKERTKRS